MITAIAGEEVAIREITFWKDGFHFGDGIFYDYTNPKNVEILNVINAGYVALLRPRGDGLAN